MSFRCCHLLYFFLDAFSPLCCLFFALIDAFMLSFSLRRFLIASISSFLFFARRHFVSHYAIRRFDFRR